MQPDYFKTCRRCSTPQSNDVTPSAARKPAPVERNPYVPTRLCTCGTENPVSCGACDSCGGAKRFPPARR